MTPGGGGGVAAAVAQEVALLTSLARAAVPRTVEHLAELGCSLETFAYTWFGCLFVNTLP
jgi:hypothetical protein|eukprot:SAG25_NODE_601_length_6632_cov_6.861319_9_plen_60_part_00